MIDLDKIAITWTAVEGENMFSLQNKEEEKYFTNGIKGIMQRIIHLREDGLPPSFTNWPADLKIIWNSGTAGTPIFIEFRIKNEDQMDCFREIQKNLRRLQELALKNKDGTVRFL